jgi:hypothetical protein
VYKIPSSIIALSSRGIYNLKCTEAVRHEGEISNAGRKKLDFAEIVQCKPVLLRLSLAGNLVKPLLSLHGIEWREHGYGFCT